MSWTRHGQPGLSMQWKRVIKKAVFCCSSFHLNQKKIHNEEGSRSFEKGGLLYKTVKCQHEEK